MQACSFLAFSFSYIKRLNNDTSSKRVGSIPNGNSLLHLVGLCSGFYVKAIIISESLSVDTPGIQNSTLMSFLGELMESKLMIGMFDRCALSVEIW